MPWTEENQRSAEKTASNFETELITKWEAWLIAIRTGAPTAASNQAAVEDVLRRWQKSVDALKSQSDSIMSNDSVMEELGQLAAQVAQEKETLRKLQSKAGTRVGQADSVNPKVRPSPYTNMLGLNRVFRSSTRTGVLVASILFGILALGSLGFLVYSVVNEGAIVVPGQYRQAGSGHSSKGHTKS